ncbi:hypothetical protein U3516DRAFT_755211, partial [Neocallimastix sp. 'constans']
MCFGGNKYNDNHMTTKNIDYEKEFKKYYLKQYITNNVIEQLTEISLHPPLRWYCPNKNCYFSNNSFNTPLHEKLIDNDKILFT